MTTRRLHGLTHRLASTSIMSPPTPVNPTTSTSSTLSPTGAPLPKTKKRPALPPPNRDNDEPTQKQKLPTNLSELIEVVNEVLTRELGTSQLVEVVNTYRHALRTSMLDSVYRAIAASDSTPANLAQNDGNWAFFLKGALAEATLSSREQLEKTVENLTSALRASEKHNTRMAKVIDTQRSIVDSSHVNCSQAAIKLTDILDKLTTLANSLPTHQPLGPLIDKKPAPDYSGQLNAVLHHKYYDLEFITGMGPALRVQMSKPKSQVHVSNLTKFIQTCQPILKRLNLRLPSGNVTDLIDSILRDASWPGSAERKLILYLDS